MPARTMLNRLRHLSPKMLKADLSAGLTTAPVAIPDGITSARLAGLNRKHSHYALMIGALIARHAGGEACPAHLRKTET